MKLKSLMTDNNQVRIGIDGMAGIGKTTLARKLGALLGAKVISFDGYLEKKKGAYLAHIRCSELSEAIAEASLPTVIDGVLLRAIAERCDIAIDLHIYVRRISGNSGIWHDDDVCLPNLPVDELKQRERELRESVAAENGDVDLAEWGLGLSGELIDYHAQW